MMVVFETRPDKLTRDAATLGWALVALQAQRNLQIVFAQPQVLEQELRSPDSLLLETAAEIGARRIFVDGIGLLRSAVLVGTAEGTETGSYRESIRQLPEWLHPDRLSPLLSCEVGVSADLLAT